MDKHSAHALRVVTGALRRAGVPVPAEAAEVALAALADDVFDGATRAEVRADLRMLRAEGLDGPASLFAGLLGFGQRVRDGRPDAREGDDGELLDEGDDGELLDGEDGEDPDDDDGDVVVVHADGEGDGSPDPYAGDEDPPFSRARFRSRMR